MAKQQNSFLLSSLLAVVGYNVANFIHFIANFALIKALSVADYGEYMAANAATTLLGIPFSIVILIVIRMVGQLKASQQEQYLILTEKRLLKSLMTWWWWLLPGYLLLLFALMRLGNFSSMASVIYLGFNLALSALITIYAGFLQGRHQFATYYQAMILAAIIKLIGFVIIYFTTANLTLAYLALILSQLGSWWYQKSHLHLKHTPTIKAGQIKTFRLLGFLTSRNFALPAITMTGLLAFANMDVIVVKQLLDENTAGFYAALTLFGKIIGYGLTPITEVIFAFAIKAKKREQNRQLLLATAIFTLASLALTLTYYYGGHWLVPLLSKKEYLSLLPWLPAMAIFGSLQTFNLLFGKQLLSANHPASSIAFFAAMLQSGGILLFHTHFNQIMAVNLTTSGLLLCFYLSKIYQLNWKEKK